MIKWLVFPILTPFSLFACFMFPRNVYLFTIWVIVFWMSLYSMAIINVKIAEWTFKPRKKGKNNGLSSS